MEQSAMRVPDFAALHPKSGFSDIFNAAVSFGNATQSF
jgi:hypothetical protein